MSIYVTTSTKSLPVRDFNLLRWLALLSVVVMFLAFILPWFTTPGAGTTLNVYDLAEWASLHPAVRSEALPLLTAFLLRFSIACAVLALAVIDLPVLFRMLAVCLTAVALLPPFEFLADTDNANYRQFFLIAIITLFGGSGLVVVSRRYHMNRWILLLIGLMCIGMALGGALHMVELMRGFGLSAAPGGGLFLYLIGGIGLIVTALPPTLTQKENRAE